MLPPVCPVTPRLTSSSFSVCADRSRSRLTRSTVDCALGPSFGVTWYTATERSSEIPAGTTETTSSCFFSSSATASSLSCAAVSSRPSGSCPTTSTKPLAPAPNSSFMVW
ncbi:Uncharacterised protein [Rothia kristinae]|nr:Uncharacterised protein [Rothia kristinae]